MSDFRSPAKNVIAQNLDIEDAYDILQNANSNHFELVQKYFSFFKVSATMRQIRDLSSVIKKASLGDEPLDVLELKNFSKLVDTFCANWPGYVSTYNRINFGPSKIDDSVTVHCGRDIVDYDDLWRIYEPIDLISDATAGISFILLNKINQTQSIARFFFSDRTIIETYASKILQMMIDYENEDTGEINCVNFYARCEAYLSRQSKLKQNSKALLHNNSHKVLESHQIRMPTGTSSNNHIQKSPVNSPVNDPLSPVRKSSNLPENGLMSPRQTDSLSVADAIKSLSFNDKEGLGDLPFDRFNGESGEDTDNVNSPNFLRSMNSPDLHSRNKLHLDYQHPNVIFDGHIIPLSEVFSAIELLPMTVDASTIPTKDEIQNWNVMIHPNVTRVMAGLFVPGGYCMLYEFAKGGTLKSYIESRKKKAARMADMKRKFASHKLTGKAFNSSPSNGSPSNFHSPLSSQDSPTRSESEEEESECSSTSVSPMNSSGSFRFSEEHVADILRQVLVGLSYLHNKGSYHGSLSSKNVHLFHDPTGVDGTNFSLIKAKQSTHLMTQSPPHGGIATAFAVDHASDPIEASMHFGGTNMSMSPIKKNGDIDFSNHGMLMSRKYSTFGDIEVDKSPTFSSTKLQGESGMREYGHRSSPDMHRKFYKEHPNSTKRIQKGGVEMLKTLLVNARNSSPSKFMKNDVMPENGENYLVKDEETGAFTASSLCVFVEFEVSRLCENVWKPKVLETAGSDPFLSELVDTMIEEDNSWVQIVTTLQKSTQRRIQSLIDSLTSSDSTLLNIRDSLLKGNCKNISDIKPTIKLICFLLAKERIFWILDAVRERRDINVFVNETCKLFESVQSGGQACVESHVDATADDFSYFEEVSRVMKSTFKSSQEQSFNSLDILTEPSLHNSSFSTMNVQDYKNVLKQIPGAIKGSDISSKIDDIKNMNKKDLLDSIVAQMSKTRANEVSFKNVISWADTEGISLADDPQVSFVTFETELKDKIVISSVSKSSNKLIEAMDEIKLQMMLQKAQQKKDLDDDLFSGEITHPSQMYKQKCWRISDYGTRNILMSSHKIRELGYLAPEGLLPMKLSLEELQKGDMWAVGVILYELLGGDIRLVIPSVFTDMNDVVAMRIEASKLKKFGQKLFHGYSRIDRALEGLLIALLRDHPDERPTASACLGHSILRNEACLVDRTPFSVLALCTALKSGWAYKGHGRKSLALPYLFKLLLKDEIMCQIENIANNPSSAKEYISDSISDKSSSRSHMKRISRNRNSQMHTHIRKGKILILRHLVEKGEPLQPRRMRLLTDLFVDMDGDSSGCISVGELRCAAMKSIASATDVFLNDENVNFFIEDIKEAGITCFQSDDNIRKIVQGVINDEVVKWIWMIESMGKKVLDPVLLYALVLSDSSKLTNLVVTYLKNEEVDADDQAEDAFETLPDKGLLFLKVAASLLGFSSVALAVMTPPTIPSGNKQVSSTGSPWKSQTMLSGTSSTFSQGNAAKLKGPAAEEYASWSSRPLFLESESEALEGMRQMMFYLRPISRQKDQDRINEIMRSVGHDTSLAFGLKRKDIDANEGWFVSEDSFETYLKGISWLVFSKLAQTIHMERADIKELFIVNNGMVNTNALHQSGQHFLQSTKTFSAGNFRKRNSNIVLKSISKPKFSLNSPPPKKSEFNDLSSGNTVPVVNFEDSDDD